MANSSPDQKSLLRKQYLQMRRRMTSEEVNARSEKLNEILIREIDWSKINKLHCFLPIAQDREPDLRPLIIHALEFADVYASYPPAKEVEELDGYAIKQFDVSESVKFDVVIVPMIAFDPKTNNRLGYGGGFYDRILLRQPHAKKLGVCYKEFAVDLPSESHDQPLDKIITV